MAKTVLVAMSGGVDSSVAAALLKEQGYAVTGATMKIWDEGREKGMAAPMGCCSLSAVEDAMAVCERLEIPYHLLDFEKYFKAEIVENFCMEYRLGRTPNPCVRCNSRLKFHHFLNEADALGCDFIATGHYARIGNDAGTGKRLLLRGKDGVKDQSYFLYGVTQDVLARLIFPVGEFVKEETRRLAERYQLPVAEKAESQEVCFIPDNDHASFLRREFPGVWKEGEILDLNGKRMGTHPGYMHYTVGQRRGLGVAHPVPLYVLEIRPRDNVIIIGPREELYKRSARVDRVHWIAGEEPVGVDRVTAKIRYRHRDADVSLESCHDGSGSCRATFSEPQEAMTPGQSIVFYAGEVVLGGGLIEAVDLGF